MGLDMYLKGKKHIYKNWQQPDNNIYVDGFRLQEQILEMGYWRKHPNLHGFIVQSFCDGIDECEEIDLEKEHVQVIIDAVINKRLPVTQGFFFGQSDGTEDEETLVILRRALLWLEIEEMGIYKSLIYLASW